MSRSMTLSGPTSTDTRQPRSRPSRLSMGAIALVLATGATLAGCAGPRPPGAVGPSSAAPSHRHYTSTEPTPTVSRLKGQSPAVVRDLLGTPDLTRREPPAEVWQYSGTKCVLDVAFYPQSSGGLSADWLDSRSLTGDKTDPDHCLSDITRQ